MQQHRNRLNMVHKQTSSMIEHFSCIKALLENTVTDGVAERHEEKTSFRLFCSRRVMLRMEIPATSAPPERIFSVATRLFGKLRNNLEPDTVSEVLFVRDAMNLYGDFHSGYKTGLVNE